MAGRKSYPTLSETYRHAWESCRALWPLFVIRFVFLILNFGAFVFCLFLGFWPIVAEIWNGFKDSGVESFESFIKSSDFTQYFTDMSWLLVAFGLFALYIIWWIFLSALFDGALYNRISEYQKNGTLFSLKDFFKDGLKYMFPMIGLEILWFFIFLGLTIAGFMAVLIGALVLKAIGIPWWVGLFFLIPGGFIAILVFLGLIACAIMAGAYLVDGHGITGSVKQSFLKCKENSGRALWGILLVWIIYFVFSMAFQQVLSAFMRIPLLGIVFLIVELVVSLALSLIFWVYLPALAVTFELEEKA